MKATLFCTSGSVIGGDTFESDHGCRGHVRRRGCWHRQRKGRLGDKRGPGAGYGQQGNQNLDAETWLRGAVQPGHLERRL